MFTSHGLWLRYNWGAFVGFICHCLCSVGLHVLCMCRECLVYEPLWPYEQYVGENCGLKNNRRGEHEHNRWRDYECVCVCDCSVTSLYHILFINNSMQDEQLITCCAADNVFKGSSWKYLLQSIVDNWVLQESGLAIHINDTALFYITPWKDRDLEMMWRDFAYEIRH